MTAVALVDSGGANIGSVRYALARLGVEAPLTDDWNVIRGAERVILPGVGAAGRAMETLQRNGLKERLPALTQPVLGICLGMQLMFDSSEEDDVGCLGILPGRVKQLIGDAAHRIPHMGWNHIERLREHPLLDGLDNNAHAYFVHSYALDCDETTLASATHGRSFAAISGRENFLAAQFHPERSAKTGHQILKNFLRF